MALVPVDDAIRRIVAGVGAVAVESVALSDALGRTLAADVAAARTQPPFPASAMDGYAVRAADLAEVPRRLSVIGMAAAGRSFAGLVGPGEAVRIFTGAPLPAGADAVLIQENATADGKTVTAQFPVSRGQNIRAAGLDFLAGEVLLPAGRVLGMREIAVAAAMDQPLLAVRRRPKIAIIATGDELAPPGFPIGPDQIVASNPYGIAAYVRSLGGEPFDLGIARDDVGEIGSAVERALGLGADVLVTLGGASVGDHDLVQAALSAKGMELDFWKIAMRPGKPLMFGRLGATRVLGLPGNPVSSLVCAILFLKPLIDALLGRAPSDPTEAAVLGADLAENDARQDYLRARLDRSGPGLAAATAFPRQDSSMLSVLIRSDCLIVRPPHAPAARAGDPCRIIRLS
jgi:molybdopterin molybdotransferase